MNLRELGEKLHDERLRQGLSLDQVIERTKISRRNIEAIEEGREGDLPHPVYTKGFIKNYARFLGVDIDDVDRALAEALPIIQDVPDEDAAKDLKRSIRMHAPRRSRSSGTGGRVWLSLFVLLLLVGAVVVLVWYWPLGDDLRRAIGLGPAQETVAPMAPAEEAGQHAAETSPTWTDEGRQAAESGQSTAGEAMQPSGGTQERAAGGGTVQNENGAESALDASAGLGNELDTLEEETPTGPGGPEQGASATPAPAAPATSAPGPTTPSVSQAAPATTPSASQPAQPSQEMTARTQPTPERPAPRATTGGNHVLEITASEPCWLEAVHASGKKNEYYLLAGEKLTIDVKDSVRVKFGNAGGVRLVFDGEPVPTDAASGDVKTFSFPK